LWRLEYTGDVTIDNEPLYWIVSQDGTWLLAAFNDLRIKKLWANLLPIGEKTKLPGSSHAAWCVYPADPTGLRGKDYADAFLVWNPVCRGFLGGPTTIKGNRQWVEPQHTEDVIEEDLEWNYQGHEPHAHYVYKVVTQSVPRKEFSEGEVSVNRIAIRPLPKGIEEAFDAADFDSMCWSLKPYDDGSA
jgi:hypothetical protein